MTGFVDSVSEAKRSLSCGAGFSVGALNRNFSRVEFAVNGDAELLRPLGSIRRIAGGVWTRSIEMEVMRICSVHE